MLRHEGRRSNTTLPQNEEAGMTTNWIGAGQALPRCPRSMPVVTSTGGNDFPRHVHVVPAQAHCCPE